MPAQPTPSRTTGELPAGGVRLLDHRLVRNRSAILVGAIRAQVPADPGDTFSRALATPGVGPQQTRQSP